MRPPSSERQSVSGARGTPQIAATPPVGIGPAVVLLAELVVERLRRASDCAALTGLQSSATRPSRSAIATIDELLFGTSVGSGTDHSGRRRRSRVR